MAQYNIEMNSFNGSSYDVLYPRTVLNNVTDWANSIYSKSQVDSQINSLESEISGLDLSLSALNRDISSLESEINTLNSGIGLLNITKNDYIKSSSSDISLGVAGPNVLFWIINPTASITISDKTDNRGEMIIDSNMWTIFVNNYGTTDRIFKPLQTEWKSFYNYFNISTSIYASGSNSANIRVIKITMSLL